MDCVIFRCNAIDFGDHLLSDVCVCLCVCDCECVMCIHVRVQWNRERDENALLFLPYYNLVYMRQILCCACACSMCMCCTIRAEKRFNKFICLSAYNKTHNFEFIHSFAKTECRYCCTLHECILCITNSSNNSNTEYEVGILTHTRIYDSLKYLYFIYWMLM